MKLKLVLPTAFVTLLAAAACSDSDGGPFAGALRYSGSSDAGIEQEGSDAARTAIAVEPVWKSTSARLELSSFGYHTGSVGYEITRELLSAEQLKLLAALREIPTPSGRLSADFTSYSVRITDQSGEVVAYRAADENVVDSDEGATDGKRTLDYATLAPFLATFDCLSAKEYETTTGTEAPGDLWAGAATFNTDPGCIHGVFVGNDASHSFRKWRIDQPATYRLSVTRCFQDMRLHLYDATGTNELAVSEFTEAPACPELTHTFDAAGEYRVDLEKRISAGAANDSAGDARLRVSRQ